MGTHLFGSPCILSFVKTQGVQAVCVGPISDKLKNWVSSTVPVTYLPVGNVLQFQLFIIC